MPANPDLETLWTQTKRSVPTPNTGSKRCRSWPHISSLSCMTHGPPPPTNCPPSIPTSSLPQSPTGSSLSPPSSRPGFPVLALAPHSLSDVLQDTPSSHGRWITPQKLRSIEAFERAVESVRSISNNLTAPTVYCGGASLSSIHNAWIAELISAAGASSSTLPGPDNPGDHCIHRLRYPSLCMVRSRGSRPPSIASSRSEAGKIFVLSATIAYIAYLTNT